MTDILIHFLNLIDEFDQIINSSLFLHGNYGSTIYKDWQIYEMAENLAF